MDVSRSKRELARARRSIPGGVNSPVRAYGSVGGVPRFIESAKGARIRDIDGNEYLDYVGSWGPMILGHAHPKVLRAVREAMKSGTSFGAPTVRETDLAEAIRRALPSVQKLRMVSSGTEATMSALRLARGVTGRSRILKFDGCYHGHSDGLLVGAGSGVATLGIPGSPGVPKAMTDLTIVAPYNDLAATRDAFERWGEDIAAIIVEPVAGNMGCVPPRPGFLAGLRKLCDEFGALLVFDEVMTGFRVAHGGAQRLYKVKPDLTTLGKVVGGGLPAAAYGGRRDLMARIAPEGDVYQAGTLSGNPLAVAAGLTTLELLEAPGVYETLASRSKALAEGLAGIAAELGVPLTTRHVGGMFGFFFHPGPVDDFAQAQQSDAAAFRRFFAAMLEEGVYLAPSAYEAGFVSLAHKPRDIDRTLEAARRALARVARMR
ncbi:MAG: glutamate-1-semialdehyde 2,1-aminomutase [Spirochaetaceae bacterium]|nr:glutamate-1-semialdehyde 2,1-aminomutase [Myxococcales bacterium]MCB9723945.1 glutamate-1-semialdehyde 2,1-aminomutase [Spirochaetaceae bacterium]HPG24524.1 glutamate-1-semialdehyde 2,1-aminomutase [Myxococcota bacterium]